jgi:drug/metabolite transporter superfamily protein YnfA
VIRQPVGDEVSYFVRRHAMQHLLVWAIFVAAACLEVGGDALVRKGLRAGGPSWILAGCLALALYGLLVNTVRWDFSRLLGVYVAVFALVSVLAGKFAFDETIPLTTWLGLAIIIAGGLCFQFGPNFLS